MILVFIYSYYIYLHMLFSRCLLRLKHKKKHVTIERVCSRVYTCDKDSHFFSFTYCINKYINILYVINKKKFNTHQQKNFINNSYTNISKIKI